MDAPSDRINDPPTISETKISEDAEESTGLQEVSLMGYVLAATGDVVIMGKAARDAREALSEIVGRIWKLWSSVPRRMESEGDLTLSDLMDLCEEVSRAGFIAGPSLRDLADAARKCSDTGMAEICAQLESLAQNWSTRVVDCRELIPPSMAWVTTGEGFVRVETGRPYGIVFLWLDRTEAALVQSFVCEVKRGIGLVAHDLRMRPRGVSVGGTLLWWGDHPHGSSRAPRFYWLRKLPVGDVKSTV